MKYVIFGDVHSNIEALNVFFKEIDMLVDVQLVCLGDIAGYSSSPNECMQLIRERDIPIVMGNHDSALFTPAVKSTFNSVASAAIEWQMKVINPSHLTFLKTLPYTLTVGKLFSVTHSDFSCPSIFSYVSTLQDSLLSFAAMKTRIGFFGHTHIPMVYTQERKYGILTKVRSEKVNGSWELKLEKGNQYLINPGSIGQPRDGNTRGAYVIFDVDRMVLRFCRFPYNCKREAKRILDANLPSYLADRLLIGS